MPRLKQSEFLAQRQILVAVWESDHRLFAYLSLADQLVLHDFYRPSEFLTDKQLIEHRRYVKRTDKSLANRAGKAYARLLRGEVGALHFTAAPRGRVVMAHPSLRPQPDVKLLAKALLAEARRTSELESDAGVAPPKGGRRHDEGDR